jgi:CHASE2 domain-containing sensor protein/tRNA A-37 threonylcarbamoyl transferase component Bud32
MARDHSSHDASAAPAPADRGEAAREAPTRAAVREGEGGGRGSAGHPLLDTLSLPTRSRDSSSRVGDLIDGKYRLEAQVGEGGMGVVYRARHLALGRAFALKLIRSGSADDPFFGDRFRSEAAALGRLKHPNIVDVTDFGIDREGDLAYLVMELLDGRTLQEEVRSRGPLDLAAALPIADAVARALDFAHSKGVLHRDLKPSNILLGPGDGGPSRVKMLDFGLARLIAGEGSGATGATGPIEGTPAYMAPESIASGVATPASDVYAFGVVVFELLTGRVPFDGPVAEILQGHLTGAPPLPSTLNARLPPEVDRALLAPLAKTPEARPRRATEVVDALRLAWLRAREREWKAREGPRRLVLAAAGGTVLAILGLVFSGTAAGRKIERPLVDAQFALQPPRAPDPRLLLVVLDEASLAADPTPLVERGDEAGRILGEVFDAGARAVAIDLLLPRQWSTSAAFSDLVLSHADALTLGAAVGEDGRVIGPEGVDPLTAAALGPARLAAMFGLVNVSADDDGVTRRARLLVRDARGLVHDTWAGRAATTIGAPRGPETIWIDAAVVPGRLPRLSWKDVESRLDGDRGLFRDRLVLVGAAYTGSGDEWHRVAGRRGGLSGIELQALVVHSALAGTAAKQMSPGVAWSVTGVGLAGVLAALLLLRRAAPGLILAAALALLGVTAAVVLFRRGWLVPLAGPLAATAAAVAMGLGGRLVLPPFPRAQR